MSVEVYQETGCNGCKYQCSSISNPKRNNTFSTRHSDCLSEFEEEINLDGSKISPHILRHSFALAYIENGGDPFSLQRILGHTDQSTTSKYVNMARTNVKAQHSKYSPGERLG